MRIDVTRIFLSRRDLAWFITLGYGTNLLAPPRIQRTA
jgi:hypothetical protein